MPPQEPRLFSWSVWAAVADVAIVIDPEGTVPTS
jgi:hypothetical protein